MNRTVALSVAFATLVGAGVAAAQPEQHNVFVHHGMAHGDADANHDGWLSRDEAGAMADRMFEQMDSNHDGRLTRDDHAEDDETFEVRVMNPDEDPNCQRTEESGDSTHSRVTIVCRTDGDDEGDHHAAPRAHRGDSHESRRVEREVTVITRGGDGDDDHDMIAPMPPMLPHGPMFFMAFGGDSEADLNHDGAMSREEFRAQHLRYFDASDANGDGRVKFDPPPAPPEPPQPPAPPRPPARH